MREVKWTKEVIISEIRNASVDGIARSTTVGPTISSTARRLFGSFSLACEAAGVTSFSSRPNIKECEVKGCDSKPRSPKEKMCEMHYGRFRRNGHVNLLDKPTRVIHTNGYVKVKSVGHPMAMAYGWSYEHRFVYYNFFGAGPFSCHWCNTDVCWKTLHIDHLDENKLNNNIFNLAASCARCNLKRGEHKQIDWSRKNGRMMELDGEVMCVSQWAARIGVSSQSIGWRLDNGWSIRDALTKGRGRFGPKPHHKIKSLREAKEARR